MEKRMKTEDIFKQIYKDLKQKLEEKMEAEYKELVEELKKFTPEQIIERAYELVVKDEIIGQIKEMNLEKVEMKAMLKEDNLLSECYEDWKNTDGTLGEIISYTLIDTIDVITTEYEKENRQKKQESR